MTDTPAAAPGPLLPGIEAHDVQTPRLRVRVLERSDGDPAARPVLFVHGNCSSSLFFMRLMLALPASVRPIAVDLRGFGGTEPAPIDATRGLVDHADDLWAVADALGLGRVDLFGWSMGGGVVMQATITAPARVTTLALQAPVSPYGFGGTRGSEGVLVSPDGAGSGAGGANPRFVDLLAARDPDGAVTDVGPEHASPRAMLRGLYVKPRPQPWPDEEIWLASILTTRVGPDHYPGDAVASPHWPGAAPGTRGVLNSLSPLYCRLEGLADITPQPPVLWVRGDSDLIVGDAALLDLATLGAMGVVPGWPGVDVCPSQPMLVQTRAVLDRYVAAGGRYRELVLPGVGHSPHLEAPQDVQSALLTLWEQAAP